MHEVFSATGLPIGLLTETLGSLESLGLVARRVGDDNRPVFALREDGREVLRAAARI